MNKLLITLGLLPAACMPALAQQFATDNAHFYRATYFYGEPRLAHRGLATLDFSIAGGRTCKSRNECSRETCLLNIYGLHNMHLLGEGVPGKDQSNPADLALINLARVPARGEFGQFIYQGRFSIVEASAVLVQNFSCGFFIQGDIPFRSLKINHIQHLDLSPTDSEYPNINTPEWQTFLNLFDTILARYDISTGPVKKSGVGDAAVLLGWTQNYQETEELDFVDFTVKAGLLLPTSKKRNICKAFDIPLAYRHLGFPVLVDFAIGAYDWFTLGTHLGVIPFKSKGEELRVKTDFHQSGFIKLARACVCVNEGTVWEAGAYAKADHIIHGFSFGFGYAFAHQNANQLTPQSPVFSEAIINSDEMFKSWTMHTINFMADYDFAKEGCTFGPRIGIFYNLVVGGKRIFKTSMAGGSLGIDIALNLD